VVAPGMGGGLDRQRAAMNKDCWDLRGQKKLTAGTLLYTGSS